MRFVVAALALGLVGARPVHPLQPVQLAIAIVGLDGTIHLDRDNVVHVRITNLGDAAYLSTYGGYALDLVFDSGDVVSNRESTFVCDSCSGAEAEKHRLKHGESIDLAMPLSRRKGKPIRGPGEVRVTKTITVLDAGGACTDQTLELHASQRVTAK